MGGGNDQVQIQIQIQVYCWIQRRCPRGIAQNPWAGLCSGVKESYVWIFPKPLTHVLCIMMM